MSAATIVKAAAKAVDWAAMEPLYRAGIVPLAQLSRDFGVSRAAIHKHAAKQGWIRALEAAGSSAADEDAAEHFIRGRDLAIGMLRAGDELHGDGSVEPLRKYRDGKAQNRFTRGALQELIRQPELLEGFAAVLSGRLGVADPLEAADFALPMAEYEPGEVGADGTRPQEDDAQPPAAAEITPAADAKEDDSVDEQRERAKIALQATMEISLMADGLRRLLINDGHDDLAYHGMLTRISMLGDLAKHAGNFRSSSPGTTGLSLFDLQSAQRGVL